MKILFVHGLASSGAYKLAEILRITLKAEVVAPDVPIDPTDALALLRTLCLTERPDLVVGLSWGGFLVQQLRGVRKALINPDLHVARLMRTMIGEVKYLSPRRDGALNFIITKELCDRYEALESVQYENDEPSLTLGLFADQDELVHCYDEFLSHYPDRALPYPGQHLPTFPEVKMFIAPALITFNNKGVLFDD